MGVAVRGGLRSRHPGRAERTPSHQSEHPEPAQPQRRRPPARPAGQALTVRHTDLRDLFYARVKAHNGATANEAALREQNGELRRRLDNLRAERDEYKQATDALARALNVQTIENDELRGTTRQTPPTHQPDEADPGELSIDERVQPHSTEE